MFALYFLNGVSQKTTQTAGKRIINVNTAPLIQQKREEEKKSHFPYVSSLDSRSNKV